MALLGRCLDMGRFCASSEPQIPAYSVLLCRLAFPCPFLTPGDGILAQQLPILCGCVGARASRTRVWKCLGESHSHADLGQCCCHPSVSLWLCLEYFGPESTFSSDGRVSALWLPAMVITLSFPISNGLGYSPDSGGELLSQAPVWNMFWISWIG